MNHAGKPWINTTHWQDLRFQDLKSYPVTTIHTMLLQQSVSCVMFGLIVLLSLGWNECPKRHWQQLQFLLCRAWIQFSNPELLQGCRELLAWFIGGLSFQLLLFIDLVLLKQGQLANCHIRVNGKCYFVLGTTSEPKVLNSQLIRAWKPRSAACRLRSEVSHGLVEACATKVSDTASENQVVCRRSTIP